MSQKNIEIKSITALHDYGAMRNYYLYKGQPRRTKTAACVLLLSFGFLVLNETPYGLSFFKPLGIAGILVFAGIYFWIDHQGRKLDKAAKFVVDAKQELEFSPEGISAYWPAVGIEKNCPWEELKAAVESDHHFFLFLEPLLPVIVPKFEMKEPRIAEFHDFISAHTDLVSDISGWKYEKI